MLRTNLSTRPFYNERAVKALLGALAALVLAVTAFNVIQGLRWSTQERQLGARAAANEAEAARILQEAAAVRARIDPRELAVVSAEATEANAIIDQRTFSWTDLLSQFEATLPADARIRAVQPRRNDAGRFVVLMQVEALEAEDVETFIDALEARQTFRDVLPREERTTESGLIEATVEGLYLPPARGAGTPAGDRTP